MVRARRSVVSRPGGFRRCGGRPVAVMAVMLVALLHIGSVGARKLQASQVQPEGVIAPGQLQTLRTSWLAWRQRCSAGCVPCFCRLQQSAPMCNIARGLRAHLVCQPAPQRLKFRLIQGVRASSMRRLPRCSSWRARTLRCWTPEAGSPWVSPTGSTARRWLARSRAASSASGRSRCAATMAGRRPAAQA